MSLDVFFGDDLTHLFLPFLRDVAGGEVGNQIRIGAFFGNIKVLVAFQVLIGIPVKVHHGKTGKKLGSGVDDIGDLLVLRFQFFPLQGVADDQIDDVDHKGDEKLDLQHDAGGYGLTGHGTVQGGGEVLEKDPFPFL